MGKKHNMMIILIMVIIFFSISSFFIKDYKHKVCLNEKCFFVEIADTDSERQRGLMGLELLKENEGMLFVFPEEGEYSFWMKNTLISLDIIWIDENFQIVNIETAVPCHEEFCENYIPKGKSLYVLEVNENFAEMNYIEVGDYVEIDMKLDSISVQKF